MGPTDMVAIAGFILLGRILGHALPLRPGSRAKWRPRIAAYGLLAAMATGVTGGLLLALA